MLEGEYEFFSGEGIIRVGAGSLLCVPRGTLHAHKSVGEDAGRMLATQTSGGLYERFFEKVGEVVGGAEGGRPAFEDRPDARTIMEVAAEHGIEIPPPIATQQGRPKNTAKGEKNDKRDGHERPVPLQECHLRTTPGSTIVFE